ncbi:MAG: UMP kinase [Nanoarchaeota archaeon]
MKVVVISLGGSLIVPNEIDYRFIKSFRKLIVRLSNKTKFVIVVGGGKTARNYINAFANENVSEKIKSLIGIAVTRLNARFMEMFIGKYSTQHLPTTLKEIKNMLKKDNIIFAGALRYVPNNTSDGTAAQLAAYLKTDFINLTNVNGLYTKNPGEFKDAKFIPKISFNEFYKKAMKIKYRAGQHFVLDQNAARIIKKHKVKTAILNGDKLKNLENYIKGKRFVGTVIS